MIQIEFVNCAPNFTSDLKKIRIWDVFAGVETAQKFFKQAFLCDLFSF